MIIQALNKHGDEQMGLYHTDRTDRDQVKKDIRMAFDVGATLDEDEPIQDELTEPEIVERAEQIMMEKGIYRVYASKMNIDFL